jgi:arginyl-tRNA synthetase
MAIGESLSRISEANGEKVIRANLYNDRGIHICKSMLAYKKWGKNKTPDKKTKSDHFVGEYYVLYNKKQKHKPELEKEVHDLLGKWEAGDKETFTLWKKMNKWAFDGFKETYKKFGITHDQEYFESEIYTEGKQIILDAVKKGILKKQEDNSVKINLEKQGLGEKYLLRADGTSIYITQDIYLADLKQKKYKLTKNYYVVGNEQDYHFKVLSTLLDKLEFKFKILKHISYGMVNLPEGKMKSREGTVVDADDLISQIQGLIKKELLKREKINKKELESRSLKITLAAIKYFLLKVDVKKDMVFNPKESISFEGDTGPYLLYSYARANSITEKIKPKIKKRNKKFSNMENELKLPYGTSLGKKEIELIKKLSDFPNILQRSYKNLNPSLIANYSYELSKVFNEFYHECPVIGSDNEFFRLLLVDCFKIILKNSLYLLGIEVLDKM